MTAQATRDALAEMDGYTPNGAHSVFDPDDRSITTYENTWRRGDDVLLHHPHPPTLDGADAAVPEGYEWERTPFEWLAWKHGSRVDGPAAKVDDTGDKIADLYALGLACRKAMENKA